MAMYGATVGKIGISATELSFNQATCGMVVGNILISYEYLYLLNKREDIINLATGSAQQNLSVGVIRDYTILLPDRTILKSFKNILEGIFVKMKNKTNESIFLTTLRDFLLPKLMSGQIKVNEIKADL